MRLSPAWANCRAGRSKRDELVRTFQFKDFRQSLSFVNKVGEAAEDAGHHPDIDIRYNRVRLSLTTHDAGGLTEKDFDLAGRATRLAS